MKSENKEITNPLTFAVVSFFNKLMLIFDAHPVKYYKKSVRNKRKGKSTILT
jgi:hypothetical protein